MKKKKLKKIVTDAVYTALRMHDIEKDGILPTYGAKIFPLPNPTDMGICCDDSCKSLKDNDTNEPETEFSENKIDLGNVNISIIGNVDGTTHMMTYITEGTNTYRFNVADMDGFGFVIYEKSFTMLLLCRHAYNHDTLQRMAVITAWDVTAKSALYYSTERYKAIMASAIAIAKHKNCKLIEYKLPEGLGSIPSLAADIVEKREVLRKLGFETEGFNLYQLSIN